jgi:hypothetical protein
MKINYINSRIESESSEAFIPIGAPEMEQKTLIWVLPGLSYFSTLNLLTFHFEWKSFVCAFVLRFWRLNMWKHSRLSRLRSRPFLYLYVLRGLTHKKRKRKPASYIKKARSCLFIMNFGFFACRGPFASLLAPGAWFYVLRGLLGGKTTRQSDGEREGEELTKI